MLAEWSKLHKVLQDPTRQKIVLTLLASSPLSYTEIMKKLQITNTGKLNYHLKKLNDILSKDANGAYQLTDKGRAAAELLGKFPLQPAGITRLKVPDAVLIGLLGLVLIAVGTHYLFFNFTPILLQGLGPYGFKASDTVLTFYMLLLPAFIMWLMTIRRTSNHDLYDLVKPPVALAGTYYLLLTLLLLYSVILIIAPPSEVLPPITVNGMAFVFGNGLVFLALPIYPILGVFIVEGGYRLKERV